MTYCHHGLTHFNLSDYSELIVLDQMFIFFLKCSINVTIFCDNFMTLHVSVTEIL
ncbi:hypothetical protein FQN60_009665 [Etheostoma spectabile]|uniref:Uncharacterized protein n=1 Tax=Etheostoma spectabile TaxID=54343 RepID=A0A5J5DJY6_9PERO|nr:hypothetical protein FQN60_009665 [Etheostoma spectabile]